MLTQISFKKFFLDFAQSSFLGINSVCNRSGRMTGSENVNSQQIIFSSKLKPPPGRLGAGRHSRSRDYSPVDPSDADNVAQFDPLQFHHKYDSYRLAYKL